MKIPFDIKHRDKIESGEYKVICGYDWPVTIVKTDCKRRNDYSILAIIRCENPGEEYDFSHWYNESGKYDPEGSDAYCPGHDLFLVTPEPELTEFEKALKSGTNIYVEQGRNMEDWDAKEDAKELLELARKEMEVGGRWYHDAYKARYEKAKEEISPLTAYDIGYDTGGRAALKDLPRWKKCNHLNTGQTTLVIGYTKDEDILYRNGKVISLLDLEKLPGFKEDEK